MTELFERLTSRLHSLQPVAIAVSGGVDSMTLALVATRAGIRFEVFHAISPAVPAAATNRVREFAKAERWSLREIDAREFQDGDYLANPYDRCFFCKQNLYAEIRKHTGLTIASGTNVDDLGDYRPGLRAAARVGVRHPLAEAGITKAGVRTLASELGHATLGALPASPCLSSRVETGIAIEPGMLRSIEAVERRIAQTHSPRTVRCRVRRDRVTVELDEGALASLSPTQKDEVVRVVRAEFPGLDRGVELAAYRMGSAFVQRPES